MKKAGIITFSAADSFGALMQCYALRQMVEKEGYDTKVIHYWPKYLRKDYRLMFNLEELKAGWNSGLKCLWRSVIYIRFRNLYRAIKKQQKMNKFRKEYLNLTSKCRTYEKLKELEKMDLYIAGSDQIWNPELTGGELDPAYFLRFAPKSAKKVTYAASTGRTPTQEEVKKYSQYLTELDGISIREKKAAEVLQQITDKQVIWEKDPTLLLSRDEWEKLLLESEDTSEYIFFFSMYYRPEQFEYVNKLAEEKGLPIKHHFYGRLSKRLVKDGGTCFFDSPQELLTKIKNAKYIVTDSFHITVFSIIFGKEFATFPSGKWSERMEALLKEYGMEDRYMGKKDEE